jgi:hypothetical protein
MVYVDINSYFSKPEFDPAIFPENAIIVVDNPGFHVEGRDNILILFEPIAILPHNRQLTIQNIDNFYTVYTCDDVILEMFPKKAKKYVGSNGSWFPKKIPNIYEKEFNISSITGSKCFPGVRGHQLRQILYYNQKLFPSNCIFFRSSHGDPLPEIGINPIVPSNTETWWCSGKEILFEKFQFSIIIENTQQKNFFTEKILDCLLTKTIPIYWGCPNIGDFFDTTGWIIFHQPNDLLEKLPNLEADHYNRYIDTINKNFEEAKKYQNFYESFNRQAHENNAPKVY